MAPAAANPYLRGVPKKPPPGLPTRAQVLDFIAQATTPAGKREIARAFGLSAQQKIALKALLKDMADEGLIDSAPGRAFHKMGGLPKVTVLRVADVDEGGNVWAVPENWQSDAPVPRIRVRERRRGALGVGERLLARTEETGQGWTAHPMKVLAPAAEQLIGVLRREGDRLWLQGVEKKERREYAVSDAGDAEAGDLVLAEKAGRPPRITARVVERLGDPFAPRSFSLIAIHRLGIPDVFAQEALDEAARVARQPLGEGREDLTHLPIVAIDPADARDHDDAVWAAPDDDPANVGGWQAIVAIADVSYYVRPKGALDREARARGNSVYFPDRVVPMLPEILSADVCSLKAGEDRAALACHLRIGKDGSLRSWRFSRALVRLAANIAYEEAQAAIDALAAGDQFAPRSWDPALVDTALAPLWDCWRALAAARDRREPLELDLPERRVVLDEKGRIMSVAPRERLDAHRLIEDYMIAANVAAAKALEAKKAPVMYRVHEAPAREKLVALKDYLATFEVAFALGQVIRPATFNHIIARVGDAEFRPEIMEQILRSQTQAYYAPLNQGHFGLALGSYAHFTSPIRRYADLMVHRALVSAYALGPGGLAGDEDFERAGETISQLERRAMEAERETIDRYVAAYLAERVGELVEARITGVTNFGFFATVEGVGGDGLMPVRDLGGEYFRYDEASRRLIGEHSGETYAQGQRLALRLAESNPVSGALRFELPEGRYGGAGGGGGRAREKESERRPPRVLKRRGRPGNIRHQGKR
ncbi:VacB/RNase II family 3'-5' exoribonuclease [Sphingomonas yunnanensis]|uniref:ribonuclease R family protein n=1 Tax=Sphingomonas yunnanensis TaxID=310400 RepID=UPI001CA78539|nr:VacB/RNase II family 3'-5' exoribonuclease [Sphingomonas yunnanensis]MBY9064328.1 VacB/RNase II family 3'-5' exoribonuclease [Sphingomonas yunnanensis]